MSSSRIMPLIYVTVRDASGAHKERVTDATNRLRKLEYTDSQSKADKCILTVANEDLTEFDDPIWSHGNFVTVSWGYPGNMSLPREVVITKVTGFTELKIEARAKSVLIDAVKKSRTFKNMTRSEIVKQIAKEYGYDADTLHLEDSGKRFAHITQGAVSDAQFIAKLAHQQGWEFYVDQEGFHFHEMKLLQVPLREYIWYSDRRGDVISITSESDISRLPTEVTKKSRDPLTKKEETAKASNTEDKGRAGLARVTITVSRDLKTGQIKDESILPVKDAAELTFIDPKNVAMSYQDKSLNDALTARTRKPYLYTPAELHPNMCFGSGDTEAKARYRKEQMKAVKLTLTAIGDPTQNAKTLVLLSNVGKRLSGSYLVKEVTHSVDPGSYQMKLKLVSDGLGEAAKKTQKLESGIPDANGEDSKAKKPPPASSDTCIPASPHLDLYVRPLMTKADRAPWLFHDTEALEARSVQNEKGETVATHYKEKPRVCAAPASTGTPVVKFEADRKLEEGRITQEVAATRPAAPQPPPPPATPGKLQ